MSLRDKLIKSPYSHKPLSPETKFAILEEKLKKAIQSLNVRFEELSAQQKDDLSRVFSELLSSVPDFKELVYSTVLEHFKQNALKYKGEKGDPGASIQGPPGRKGDPGESIVGPRGPKGDKPVEGVDYFIPEPIPSPPGSPDSPDDVVHKVNRADLLIGLEKIAGLEEILKRMQSRIQKAGYLSGSGGSAGSATTVVGEVVAGSGTSFTLAHTPNAGTLAVYAIGQRLTLTTDYTRVGTAITTILSWSAGDLQADYQY